MTPETFRQTFREFADPDTAPELALNFWITLAGNFINGSATGVGQRWDAVTQDYAIGLFVAHHAALSMRNVATAAAGGVPGDVRGPATSKSVDKVAVSYDSKAVTWENQAFWNQTQYGIQLMDLARMFGAGPVQLGVSSGAGNNTAWPGFGLYLNG